MFFFFCFCLFLFVVCIDRLMSQQLEVSVAVSREENMSVAANVAELEARVKALEEVMNSISADDFDRDLEDEELARLNLVLAFSLSSLFYMFLRVQGVNTATHPVQKELQRVQTYIAKLKSASEANKMRKANNDAASKLLQSVAAEQIAVVGDEEDEDKKKKKKKKKSKKEKKRSRESDE